MASRALQMSIGGYGVGRAVALKHVRAISSSSHEAQYGSTNYTKFSIKKATAKSNTIVVMFGFYGATDRALKNYCDLYQSFGFDVMHVPSYLKQFAWPKNSVELADNLLSYLKASCSSYDQIVIHAFSMGAYNFTVCMGEMYTKPEYSSVQQNIKAVVYDSLTIGKLRHMAIGVGQGVSRNKIVQTVIPLTMSMYFRLTYAWTVKFYNEYISLFKRKPLEVPTLVFACKNDPMSQYAVVEDLEKNWRQKFSFPLVVQSWEKSKHSAHLLVHKNDYTRVLTDFLNSVPGLINVQKTKSNL